MTNSEKRLTSIGRILLEAKKLTPEQVDSITAYQNEHGGKFGEVAVKLRLLSLDDLHAALARQFSFPLASPAESGLSPLVVAAFDPYDPVLESLRDMRTHLLLNWLDAGNRTLLVVEAEDDNGAEFVLSNLSVLFSQMGLRTLLIDANLRSPGIHRLFGFEPNVAGLADVLASRSGPEVVKAVNGLPDLFVLPAGTLAPNPQELLGNPRFVELLAQVREKFEVILVRTPAASNNADAQLIASRCEGALVSVKRNASRLRNVSALKSMLTTVACPVYGVVLND